MYQREGIKGMFQGNGTNCVRIVPNSAVKFLAYEQISRYMQFTHAMHMELSSPQLTSSHKFTHFIQTIHTQPNLAMPRPGILGNGSCGLHACYRPVC